MHLCDRGFLYEAVTIAATRVGQKDLVARARHRRPPANRSAPTPESPPTDPKSASKPQPSTFPFFFYRRDSQLFTAPRPARPTPRPRRKTEQMRRGPTPQQQASPHTPFPFCQPTVGNASPSIMSILTLHLNEAKGAAPNTVTA